MVKEKDWFKDRGYPHFSNKTPKRDKNKIETYISNPKKVATHSFYPLIYKQIIQRRYKLSNFNDFEKRSHKKIENGNTISNKKIREILYATHIDSHIYSYYTQKIISPKYEKALKNDKFLDEAITAYRQIETENRIKFKNNIHFARDVFDEIRLRQNCVVLAFDIENFFPSLDHALVKKIWSRIIGKKSLPKDHYNLFKSVTNFSYVRLNDLKMNRKGFNEKILSKHRKSGKNTFFSNILELVESEIIIRKNQKINKKGKSIGIPQGLPISSLLANMYMLPFDEAIVKYLSKPKDVFYRRYSDDIIIICNQNEVEIIEEFILNEIKKINLKISKEKTEKTLFKIHNNRLQSFRLQTEKIDIPLQYLGFEFYGYKTLIKSKNLSAFYREMKLAVKRKNNRIEKIKEIHLVDNAPIFKRKLYRLYSYKGVKSRKIPITRTKYYNGNNISKIDYRKFRGNYIKYAYTASDELNSPEIKRQLRRHWKILQATMAKYEFNNVKPANKD